MGSRVTFNFENECFSRLLLVSAFKMCGILHCDGLSLSLTHTQHTHTHTHTPSYVADMWYVNADGKEGWLPSNILRSMIGDDMALTSGESTPADIKFSSTGASADASDMSDSDGEFPDSY